MAEGLPLSAVVVTFHTGPVLWQCLDALLACPDLAEIVIVDNGNPEADAHRLDAFARGNSQVRLVQGQGNVGFARGCNLGAATACGRALLFLNPDCVIALGAGRALLSALQQRKRAPLVLGGRILNVDGSEQRGGRRDTMTLWRAVVSFSGLSRLGGQLALLRDLHRERDPVPERPISVGAVSGAMLCLLREDFERLGGFDEGYFLHVEDLDICRRAHEAGGDVWFVPDATARHARSTSDVTTVFVEQHKARGFNRYFRKFAKGP
ncbi:MAG: glycosyltransferase, partial [Caulobacterales bacterium]